MGRYDKEVAAGWQLLIDDAALVGGDIDLDALDMGDENECILGQVYGRYYDGLTELYGPQDGSDPMDDENVEQWAREHGFTAEHLYHGEAEPLRRAWIRRLSED